MLWFLTRRGYLPPAQPPLIVTSPGEKTNLTQKQPTCGLREISAIFLRGVKSTTFFGLP